MAKPNSRDTLIDYCLRALGAPVIEINLDDDQIGDRIDAGTRFCLSGKGQSGSVGRGTEGASSLPSGQFLERFSQRSDHCRCYPKRSPSTRGCRN